MQSIDIKRRKWWENKRKYYNLGLIISGIVAFILYVILGTILIMPYDHEFEITLFTIVFQGFGYLLLMLIANLFYFLGNITDRELNKNNDENFRKNLFKAGLIFSVSLPFLIPIMIVITYFLEFA